MGRWVYDRVSWMFHPFAKKKIASKLFEQVKAFLSDEEVDHFMKLLEARVVRCWMHH